MNRNKNMVRAFAMVLLFYGATICSSETVPPPTFGTPPPQPDGQDIHSEPTSMVEDHNDSTAYSSDVPQNTVSVPDISVQTNSFSGTINSISGENPSVGHSISSGINFKSDKEEQVSDDSTVDTVKVESGGNWLLKRVWWEKTEDIYAQVKEAFNKVMTSRMSFFSDRNKFDKSLDQFYQNIGLEQGPLQDILNFSLEIIQKQKEDDGLLNKKERDLLEKIQDKQRTFDQLKKDVDAIEVLDTKIDEALDVVLQQINLCNKYEQQAWENFKNIARELNDKEARKQYYDTKGLLDDIEKINTYLTGAFSQYFNQTIQTAQDHMKSIATQMSTLKNDGVDLKKEAEKLEEDDVVDVKEKKDEKKEAPVEKKTFLQKIYGIFNSFFEMVKGLLNNLVSKISHLFTKSDSNAQHVVNNNDQKKDAKDNEKNTGKKNLEGKVVEKTSTVPVDQKKEESIFDEASEGLEELETFFEDKMKSLFGDHAAEAAVATPEIPSDDDQKKEIKARVQVGSESQESVDKAD